MFLLDTDVISELRRWEGVSNLTAWMEAQRPSDLYISVVSLGRSGTGHNPPAAPQPCSSHGALASWLDSVLVLFTAIASCQSTSL